MYIMKKGHDSRLKVKVMDASSLIFHPTPHYLLPYLPPPNTYSTPKIFGMYM